jgi:hypothetical protein
MNPEVLSPEAPPPHTDVDLFERMNPRSLINLLPDGVQSDLIEATRAKPELFTMDERTLFLHLRAQAIQPTPTDNRLRLSFWVEYDRAQFEVTKMNMTPIYAGVCVRQYFYSTYLKNAWKVAWLLCPPTNYVKKLEEALDFGIDRMRDILEMSPMDERGKPNVKLMELQTKITIALDQRAKGSYTQRIEQKSVNLQIGTSDKAVAQAALTGSMDEIQKRMKELERRERLALNLPVRQDEGSKEKEVSNTAE